MKAARLIGETYLCGNPPYIGSKKQSREQKSDLAFAFHGASGTKTLDYVSGWFIKAALFGKSINSAAAFVATNSICQGQHVSTLWPRMFKTGQEISFAHTSFRWSNLAAHKAGVTVVIVGMRRNPVSPRLIFSLSENGAVAAKSVRNINAYLIEGPNIEVAAKRKPISQITEMQFGNHPYYAGALILTTEEARAIESAEPAVGRFLRPFYGSTEFIDSAPRRCLWITPSEVSKALQYECISTRVVKVETARRAAVEDKSAQKLASTPWRFREQVTPQRYAIIVPRVSSESREYLPVGVLDSQCVVQEKAFAMYDAPLWNLALIASRLHWVWIATVCVRLEMRFSYSNTLGWNTFPVPALTEANKADLTHCAEDILLARERHFPATIADLYDPDKMPDDLRAAHERNDETLAGC